MKIVIPLKIRTILASLLMLALIMPAACLSGCGREEAAQPQPKEAKETAVQNTMSIEEYKSLSDDGKLAHQNQVQEIFGSPDATATADGRSVWLYFDRLHNDEDKLISLKFVFYTTEDLIEYNKSMGITKTAEDFPQVQTASEELGDKEDYMEKYKIK